MSPDFIVETASEKLLCETKMAKELDAPVVLAKAKAGKLWCERASAFELEYG